MYQWFIYSLNPLFARVMFLLTPVFKSRLIGGSVIRQSVEALSWYPSVRPSLVSTSDHPVTILTIGRKKEMVG